MIKRASISTIALIFTTLAAVPPARSESHVWRTAEPSEGTPKCEEFFEKWEAPGISSQMLGAAGVGRELMAAADCVQRNDIAKACRHLKGLLPVMDKLGPPWSDNRYKVENQLQEYKCASIKDTER